MNKAQMMKAVNPLLMLSFVVQAATGIIMFFEFRIPGAELNAELHRYNGMVMIALAATHLYLNWGWVKSNMLKARQK